MMSKVASLLVFATLTLLFHANHVDCGKKVAQILSKISEIENNLGNKIDLLYNFTKEELPTCSVQTCNPVCQSGEMCVNLDDTGAVNGSLPGVSFHSPVTSLFGKPCSRQAVIKVHFLKDNHLEPCTPDNAFNIKLPPQRMLKIQMYFSNGERSGFMFNIGDSVTNNGYGGDAGTQSHDAEVQGLGKNINIYGSDTCPTPQLQFNHIDALKHPVSMANFWIKNKYLRVTNDFGLFDSACNNCLFALNGQTDAEGVENEDIYIGANRVVSSTTRTGVGLCFMKLRWVSTQYQ